MKFWSFNFGLLVLLLVELLAYRSMHTRLSEMRKWEDLRLSLEKIHREIYFEKTRASIKVAAAASKKSSMEGVTGFRAYRMNERQQTQHGFIRAYQDGSEQRHRDTRYQNLWSLLQLDTAAQRQMQAFLEDRRQLPDDVNAALQKIGRQLPPEVNAWQLYRDELKRAQQQLDDRIKALLGPDKFATYVDFQENEGARLLLAQLNQTTGRTAETLSPMQAEGLYALLKQSKPVRSRGGTMVFPVAATIDAQVHTGNIRFSTMGAGDAFVSDNGAFFANWPITEDVLNRAAPILTPAQYSALQEVCAQQQAGRALAAILGF